MAQRLPEHRRFRPHGRIVRANASGVIPCFVCFRTTYTFIKSLVAWDLIGSVHVDIGYVHCKLVLLHFESFPVQAVEEGATTDVFGSAHGLLGR